MAIDIGTVDYNQAIAAVSNYYQTDPGNVIDIINEYGLTPEQLYETLPTTDNIWNVTYSNSGAILGTDSVANIQYAGATQAAEAAAAMNSNVATATQATKTLTNVPAQTTIGTGGTVSMTRGVTSAATGNPVLAVADKVGLGVIGVSVGCKAGAFIDRAAYAIGGLIWDDIPDTINPETWDDMATTEGGKQLIRTIFGLHDDGTSGMYIPENVFAAFILGMAKEGVFQTSGYEPPVGYTLQRPNDYSLPFSFGGPNFTFTESFYGRTFITTVSAIGSGEIVSCYFRKPNTPPEGSQGTIMCISDQPFEIIATGNRPGSGQASRYGWGGNIYYAWGTTYGNIIDASTAVNILQPTSNGNVTGAWQDPYVAYFHGTGGSAMEGVTPQPGATYPNINPNANVADVLAQLKTLYPDLWDKALTETVVQPDGATKTYTYVPMPVTDTSNLRDPEPTNTTTTQNDYIVDPATTPQDILDTITRYLTGTQQLPDGETVPLDPTVNPPDTGSGDTPDVILPVGNASALWSVYNPTLAEINSFGSWLWSSNFIDQLLKMFNDPMQSIIGLHKIFVPPVIGSVSNIVVGYLDSGVSANTVPTQYASLDCGSINLLEYFGNVFDYSPFTRVYIYLPFIGFRELDTALVMRSTINVTYHADMYTGAGLAEISAIRDSGAGGVIYQFSCDLAAKYPLSQGSYMGIVASIATLATGILSGNPLLTASSAISAVGSAKTKTEMSGSFTGNSGALGIKKPYLVIIRPQSQIADGYHELQGNSDNAVITVSDISGYARFTDIELINIDDATIDELQEIESYLINGIHI